MREDEVRRIVAEVVGFLADKGYLKAAPQAASALPAQAPSRVTVGTAGKVFAEPLVAAAKPAPAKASAPAAAAKDDEVEHTAGPDCPHCAPVGKMEGAKPDRLTVCHPTRGCAPVAGMIDHTLLKPNATQEEVAKLCEEARQYGFASVCVNPAWVPLAAKLLKGSAVKVCTVIGFPLGSTTATVKAIEARDAIANGAEEIDMVLNVGALKSGNDALVFADIQAVREATRGRVLKVILETAYLTKEEKVRACLLSKKAGADFVKTSTGFGPGGATAEDILLMSGTVGPGMGVKASGGIRDAETARKMVEAGATRIGASASVAIAEGKAAEKGGKY